jgi:hypothetical protein
MALVLVPRPLSPWRHHHGYARYRCVVEDGQGGRATGYGTETAADFADYCERAETRALGRSLAALGIGTQFVGQDLTEGAHVADAPVAPPDGNAVQPVSPPVGQPVHGDAPRPPWSAQKAACPVAGSALPT